MGKNQSASGLTNVIQYNNGNITFVSGSTTLMSISSSGAITTTGVISGSNVLTASYANNAELLDGLDSTAFATTGAYSATSGSLYTVSSSAYATSGSLSTASGSFNTRVSALEATGSALSSSILSVSSSAYATSGSLSAASGSFNSRVTSLETYSTNLTAKTASFATTGSNIFIGSQVVSGSLTASGSITATGTITAQTLVVQTITSSVVYSSGSNVFGNDIGNSQRFTGSVLITGSLTIAGASSATSYNGATIFGSTIACSPIGCFATSCATSFIGGTMSGTTIYGSTAVCSPVGLFSGCIGIGTITPNTYLQIVGNISTTTGLQDAQFLTITNSNATANNYSAIMFKDSDGNNSAGFGVQQISHITNEADIVLSPRLANGDITERIRIKGNGNVGIGTASPCAKLHINGSTGASTYKGFAYTYAGSETLINEVLFQAVVGGYSSNLPIFLFKDERSDQGTTQRIFEIQGGRSGVGTILTTLASGNVGIGTSSPGRTLEVSKTAGVDFGLTSVTSGTVEAIFKGYASGTNIDATTSRGTALNLINLDTTNGNANAIIFHNSNQLATSYIVGVNVNHTSRTGDLIFGTSNAAAPTERMRITSGGLVQINHTNTAKGNLDVAADVNAVPLVIRGRSADGEGQVEFWNYAGSTRYGVLGSTSNYSYFGSIANTPLFFQTNSTERMRIASTGIACFACQICVKEAVYINGSFPGVKLDRAGTSAQSDINWKDAGTSVWSIGTAVRAVGSSLDFYSYCTGDNVFKLTQTGITCFSNTVCAPIITSNAGSLSLTGIGLLITLATESALYIITAQPEAGSGTSAAALITSRTNQNPSVQTIVSSSSLSFVTSGYSICLCSNLGYSLSAKWGIIRLA